MNQALVSMLKSKVMRRNIQYSTSRSNYDCFKIPRCLRRGVSLLKKVYLIIFSVCVPFYCVTAQATFFNLLTASPDKPAICQTYDNGFAIAFQYAGQLNIMKLNSLGITQFQKSFVLQGAMPEVTDIKQTNDSGFVVTANTSNRSLIIKTTAVFDTMWTKYVGKPGYFLNLGNIEELPNGNFVAFGVAYGSLNNHYAFMLKMNGVGDTIFTKSFKNISTSNSSWQLIKGAKTQDGGYLLYGYTNTPVIKIDSLGQFLWQYTYSIIYTDPKVVCTSLNENYVAHLSGTKIGIDKIDSVGNIIYRKIIDLGSMALDFEMESNYLGGFTLLAGTLRYPCIINSDSSGNLISNVIPIDTSVISFAYYHAKDLVATSDSGFISLFKISPNYLGVKKYDKNFNSCTDLPLSYSYIPPPTTTNTFYFTYNYWPVENYDDTISYATSNFNYINMCSNINTVSNVWPGDCNYDLSVNNIDFIYLNIANTDTGSIRPNASSAWIPQPSLNWVNSFNNGANFKHADTNGDGVINLADTLAINQNYNFNHPFRTEQNPLITASNYLQLISNKDTVFPGDTIALDIQAGSSIGNIDSLYGLAFSIEFDTSAIDTGFIQLNYFPSVLGVIHTDMESFQKSFNSYGKIDLALSRTDQNNAINFNGSIGQIKFISKGNIINTTTIHFNISQIQALTYNQSLISFNGIADSIVIYVAGTSVNEPSLIQEFNISPNPVKGGSIEIKHNLPTSEICNLEITDIKEQRMCNIKLTDTQTQSISVNALPSGIYNIKITCDHGVYKKRIVILK